MQNKTFLILGGYGGVGKSISNLILKEMDVDLIIAGRRLDKAKAFATELSNSFPNRNIEARYADASKPECLPEAFKGVDFVIVAAVVPKYLKQIAQAAAKYGCYYLDITVQQNTLTDLRDISPEFEKAGKTAISQAGFHPGLPAVFIRHLVSRFDTYIKANIGLAMNTHFMRPASTREIIHEIGQNNAEIFKGGKWKKATYKDSLIMNFGPVLGLKSCVPLRMEELKPLPRLLGLEKTGVYTAGFNWFVDSIVFPLAVMLPQIKKGLGAKFLEKLMFWGVNKLSPPEEKVVFILDAEGLKDGTTLKIKLIAEHADAYYFTAAPVVACLKQCLAGTINEPGMHLMGNLVNTGDLIEDMKKMGISFREEVEKMGINQRL